MRDLHLVSGRRSRGQSQFSFASIRIALLAAIAIAVSASGSVSVRAEDQAAALKKTRDKAINYLRTSQADDGSWTSPMAPGLTGLVVTGLLENGVKVDDPMIDKALKQILKHVQPDGGIYFVKSNYRNYETCIIILALEKANTDGRYKDVIANADKFIRSEQIDEGEGKEKSDPAYGGAGYGKATRPDLSNTHYLIEALRAAGAKPDDPALQKALLFVSRTQNLESEKNDTPFGAKINDGGFFYTPAGGGSSGAGKEPNGGLRSYGSMTYAGLKSMLYAGVKEDDPRVKAAYEWIRKHYSVTENPGLEQQGLYYYHHTFAKALDAIHATDVEDASGKKHDWRADLVTELAKTQRENGSWVNAEKRWNEGDPNLATAFALLALSHCDAPAAAK
jgi:squalene-hopene/tetraprenyl-beta-curcumene cyclase